eukprot:CCRYP_010124-RA/>CCRYP_010124-RA protein AED:0.48 eAED:0.45 QI:0/0/0/1/0/0/3/0/131
MTSQFIQQINNLSSSSRRRHKSQTAPSTNLSSLTPLWNDLASSTGTIRALVDTPGSMGSNVPPSCHRYCRIIVGECFHCVIVGINQIFDRDIDVLNRQFLPVASGEMSGRVALVIVLLNGIWASDCARLFG